MVFYQTRHPGRVPGSTGRKGTVPSQALLLAAVWTPEHVRGDGVGVDNDGLARTSICHGPARKREELVFRPQYATEPHTLPGGAYRHTTNSSFALLAIAQPTCVVPRQTIWV